MFYRAVVEMQESGFDVFWGAPLVRVLRSYIIHVISLLYGVAQIHVRPPPCWALQLYA
jgi:hypothetical protein